MELLEKTSEMTIGNKLHLLTVKANEYITKIYDWYNVVCKLQKRFK